MAKPPRRVIALRHMTRFQCLGGECEDTCCQTWNVSIDQSHYTQLKRLMKAPDERALFDATFVLKPPAQRTRDGFAAIQMRDDDLRCPLLSAESLCTLHQKHGDRALPDICSFYPRHVSDIGGRLELSGAMSCPEVVRQALLVPDGVELVEADAALLGRAPVVQRPLREDAPLVDEVRGTMLMLLDRAEYPIASRLFFLSYLAIEATPSLAAHDLDALSAVTERVSDTRVLDGLHNQMRARAAPSARMCLALVNQLARVRGAARPAFRAEIDRVVNGYVADRGLARSSDGVAITEDFFAVFENRRRSLAPELAEHLEMVTHHYAATYCLRELYLRKNSFEAHVLELQLRVAVWRFLLLSEPAALTDRTRFDARLVSIIYQIARVVDHSPNVGDSIIEGMGALLPSLDAVAGLLII